MFLLEGPAAISTVAVVAVLASTTEARDNCAAPWRLESDFDPRLLFEVISSSSALSGSVNNGQQISHLQLIINTDVTREELGSGLETYWRWIMDDPSVFPQEVWQLIW